jgi:hypothetical protein
MKRRIYLTYPTKLVTEPIVCEMYDAIGVRFNLRTASVNDEIGIIGMELEGEPERVDAAMAFFRARGVRVEAIELDVLAG